MADDWLAGIAPHLFQRGLQPQADLGAAALHQPLDGADQDFGKLLGLGADHHLGAIIKGHNGEDVLWLKVSDERAERVLDGAQLFTPHGTAAINCQAEIQRERLHDGAIRDRDQLAQQIEQTLFMVYGRLLLGERATQFQAWSGAGPGAVCLGRSASWMLRLSMSV